MRTEKDTSDWKTGKLNGKRLLTTQKEQKADYGASTCHQSVDIILLVHPTSYYSRIAEVMFLHFSVERTGLAASWDC
jgi:hypothetical protein